MSDSVIDKEQQELLDNEYIKLKTLIDEINSSRMDLKTMLTTMKEFRSKLEVYIPDPKVSSNDIRNKKITNYERFALQENMKNVTNILNTELGVHKAIENSIKTEFDLTQKLVKDMENKVDDNSMDISVDDIAHLIDKIKKENK